MLRDKVYKCMNTGSYKMQPRNLPFVVKKFELIYVLQKSLVSSKKLLL
jgi:hypothetical protein